MNRARSEQEDFWADKYAQDYIKKNSQFDNQLGADAWKKMLHSATGEVSSYLECGCNIGRNVDQLKIALPAAKASIIEISKPAFNFITARHHFEQAFNGAILESTFEEGSFDLVFTMGVLIHINPGELLANMERIHKYSRKYILIGEYFNRTPTSIDYQGEKDRLFKRDFGKLFIENFDVKLVDYGFLWGHIYDLAGFDDITWWLFEKR
jgi:pseudaminic acid biosynthesis-associated methylase